jgi:hypothetical protein
VSQELSQGERKHLSADALLALLRTRFDSIADPRGDAATISLSDALMAAFAMFSLKSPSLLAFDQARCNANFQSLYHLQHVPCDTAMREILDPISPSDLRGAFGDVFRQVQRGKLLESYVFYQGCYLLLLDGTGYFSSKSIHCDSCLTKVNEQTGEVTYSHQMLGACLAHPDHREVIPFAPEPIIQQDGQAKNDCERNAAKRFLVRIRHEHPHLKLIVVEDSLSSNAPHVRDLRAAKMHFILGVKRGDHAYLYQHVDAAIDQGRALQWTCRDVRNPGVTQAWVAVNDVPLNASNADERVNYISYLEIDGQGELLKSFDWITDFEAKRGNGATLMRGGRCRWKVENETFNTLKNQGYHFEHNFGHGYQNLSVVFAYLMMLAFLVDQVQQLCCRLFRAVWKKMGTKRRLWEQLRSHFEHFVFTTWRHLYQVMLSEAAKGIPAPRLDSS